MRALLVRALLALGLASLAVAAPAAVDPAARGLAAQAKLATANNATAVAANAAALGPVLYHAQGLHHFRAALDGALTAPVFVDVDGDSIVEAVCTQTCAGGVTDNVVADRLGFPGQMRTWLAKRYGVTEGGMITPQHSGTDTRHVNAGTTNLTSTGPEKTCVSMTSASNAGAAGTITYSLPTSSEFRLLIYQNTASPITGSFTYAVDGGTAVSVANSAAGYTMVSVSGLALSTHSVVVSATSANPTYQCGIAYDSGAGVVVMRHGRSGWMAADSLGRGNATDPNANASAVGNTAAQARLLAAYGAWGAQLTIIAWKHNDWANQLETIDGGSVYESPTVYAAYLRSMVAQAVASGSDVLLVAPALPPTQTVPGELYPISQYRDAMKAIALDPSINAHVAFLDMQDRVGSIATALADGFYGNSTTVHPSILGYGVMARAIIQALESPAVYGPASDALPALLRLPAAANDNGEPMRLAA